MPKFIIDECTGIAVVHFMREQGYDVVGVSEAMPQASDFDILQCAKRRHLGILLLRLADDRVETKIRVVAAVLALYADHLENRFVVATEENIRLRPPL
jgi:predicted nuclease of predicted toxin-antitoxin system